MEKTVFVIKGDYFIAGNDVWHLSDVGCYLEKQCKTREEALKELNFLVGHKKEKQGTKKNKGGQMKKIVIKTTLIILGVVFAFLFLFYHFEKRECGVHGQRVGITTDLEKSKVEWHKKCRVLLSWKILNDDQKCNLTYREAQLVLNSFLRTEKFDGYHEGKTKQGNDYCVYFFEY